MAKWQSSVEIMVMINQSFWQNKHVILTGCTGFKGSWLTIWLHLLGAKVYGYSLPAPTNPSMWEDLKLEKLCQKICYADIRDYDSLLAFVKDSQTEIVIHMAAQPLVRYSYMNPRETYEVNVMGCVNLFDAVRQTKLTRAVINVTTDKCYENKEWIWPYREHDPMGGHDPYSNSKGCAELVTTAYMNSYFSSKNSPTFIASGRAGNVIGGGDWANDRLIPDIVRNLHKKEKAIIRNPNALRPWQHVLEPLSGYLCLAEKLYTNGQKYSGGWNFGPQPTDKKTVGEITKQMLTLWGDGASWVEEKSPDDPHEAHLLALDCSKAFTFLQWQPVWDSDIALEKLTAWYKAYFAKQDLLALSIQQIRDYMGKSKC